MPANLGEAADMLYKLREKKSEINRKVKLIEDYEKQVKDYIIQNLPKSSATGVTGKLANAKITQRVVPTVTNWDDFAAYIEENNAIYLLQRRINESAVKEFQDSGEEIPGVGKFTVINVSCTKA